MAPDLRGAMRHFATGVCVATTYTDRSGVRVHDAVTVNSLTSVSLDPALVSVCLRPDSAFLADLLATKKWALSILDDSAAVAARRCAGDRASRAGALAGLRAAPGAHTGALVLDAPGWLECVLWDSIRLGDHTMVVGEVVAAGVGAHRPPLVYLRGRYHSLDDDPNQDRGVTT
ncbi:flavin reductase family protein [Saccharothrix obliqua]|uniref:flavin reductase family protein n=1 Tax=Saccharothrix obliqua TaxID=2861747 RepID=UPI001C607CAA|nr:flavin reductase family protein [Saccharothrix obliqua]MBW4718020.1 flavin reductase family protein [Saccharothrix obliqua]